MNPNTNDLISSFFILIVNHEPFVSDGNILVSSLVGLRIMAWVWQSRWHAKAPANAKPELLVDGFVWTGLALHKLEGRNNISGDFPIVKVIFMERMFKK